MDAVNTLGYVSVYNALTYDNYYSSLKLTCLLEPEGCLERLMEDLPEKMEKYL